MMAKKRTMIFVLTVVCMFSLMITTSCKGCFDDENTSSGITVPNMVEKTTKFLNLSVIKFSTFMS